MSKEENIRRNEILIKSWCFINVQLKTQNSASAIVHSCFSAANETSLCEPAFLFLCGPLIAKTGCTLHCFHRQVAQRRNNGSPIHSICAAFQVGLSQTFSHSQKGPEEGATIWVQDMLSQLLCLFVQISHNYHGYERFLDLFIERCFAKILGDLSTFLANGMY